MQTSGNFKNRKKRAKWKEKDANQRNWVWKELKSWKFFSSFFFKENIWFCGRKYEKDEKREMFGEVFNDHKNFNEDFAEFFESGWMFFLEFPVFEEEKKFFFFSKRQTEEENWNFFEARWNLKKREQILEFCWSVWMPKREHFSSIFWNFWKESLSNFWK